MRKISVLAICFFAFAFTSASYGQVRVGIKGGLSTSEVPASTLNVVNPENAEQFELSIKSARYGLHFGFFLQAQFGNFFMQPELLFNTVSMEYSLEGLRDSAPVALFDEVYRNLDVPLILGLKAGPVRLGGGPVGHVFLDSTSDLLDIPGYRQDFKRISWGWQAGVGLDIWKLHFDARYEGNFSKYGDHIEFFGGEYQFSESPSRIIASIGISF